MTSPKTDVIVLVYAVGALSYKVYIILSISLEQYFVFVNRFPSFSEIRISCLVCNFTING